METASPTEHHEDYPETTDYVAALGTIGLERVQQPVPEEAVISPRMKDMLGKVYGRAYMDALELNTEEFGRVLDLVIANRNVVANHGSAHTTVTETHRRQVLTLYASTMPIRDIAQELNLKYGQVTAVINTIVTQYNTQSRNPAENRVELKGLLMELRGTVPNVPSELTLDETISVLVRSGNRKLRKETQLTVDEVSAQLVRRSKLAPAAYGLLSDHLDYTKGVDAQQGEMIKHILEPIREVLRVHFGSLSSPELGLDMTQVRLLQRVFGGDIAGEMSTSVYSANALTYGRDFVRNYEHIELIEDGLQRIIQELAKAERIPS
jgi:hypothetical protein